MQYLIVALLILALYAGAGTLMAWFESSQNDDPFKKMTILTWLPKMFGLIK